jgi:ribosome-associated protein
MHAGDATEVESGLRVLPELLIPRTELSTKATRASGAGGQHVNKTSSRIELTWNIAASPSLSDAQRAQLLEKLRSRITADGDLRIVASATRSQFQNREIAEERLKEIVAAALRPVKKRKATKPTRAAKEARLATKKKHSTKKRDRQARLDD